MKDYRSMQGKTYMPESIRFGSTSIPVLEFLKGLEWDSTALGFVHALRPNMIRVITPGTALTVDSQRWRVTVVVDEKNIIQEIKQEVQVWLPDDVEDGYGLRIKMKVMKIKI